jgi:hypothetical protein
VEYLGFFADLDDVLTLKKFFLMLQKYKVMTKTEKST